MYYLTIVIFTLQFKRWCRNPFFNLFCFLQIHVIFLMQMNIPSSMNFHYLLVHHLMIHYVQHYHYPLISVINEDKNIFFLIITVTANKYYFYWPEKRYLIYTFNINSCYKIFDWWLLVKLNKYHLYWLVVNSKIRYPYYKTHVHTHQQ